MTEEKNVTFQRNFAVAFAPDSNRLSRLRAGTTRFVSSRSRNPENKVQAVLRISVLSRRFQFRLGTLLVAVAVCAVAALGWREQRARTRLEGNWRGTGQHASLSISFHRDLLAISNRAGIRQSNFLVAPDGTIDIYRDDGLQLGRYELAGDKLQLRLANVDRPRPQDLLGASPQLPHGPVHVRARQMMPAVRRQVAQVECFVTLRRLGCDRDKSHALLDKPDKTEQWHPNS